MTEPSKAILPVAFLARKYCEAVESAGTKELKELNTTMQLLLPRLYAAVFDIVAERDTIIDDPLPLAEGLDLESYTAARDTLAAQYGDLDTFLEATHTDLKFEQEAVAREISEILADIYQFTCNVTQTVRDFPEDAGGICLTVSDLFREYIAAELASAIKAVTDIYLHLNPE